MAGRSWALTESEEKIGLVFGGTSEVIVCSEPREIYHLVYKGTILGGLEGAGLEIFRISREVKGISGKLLVPVFQFSGADRRDKRGINASRQKVQMGTSETICLLRRPGEGNLFFHRIFKRIGMRQAFQLPVGFKTVS